MVIVILGVSGAGKTTVGKALARELGLEFFEGDDFHPAENRNKMHAGIALTDADRRPWLAALRRLIDEVLDRGGDAVLACSALRQSYRDELSREGVKFVYLKARPEVIRQRLEQRRGHFFDPKLLDSQFATLEEPQDALTVNAEQSVPEIVSDIRRRLENEPRTG